jgi:homoserine dehydrogenase
MLQVGAGLPIITAVGRFLTAGDHVYQIVGALSGET